VLEVVNGYAQTNIDSLTQAVGIMQGKEKASNLIKLSEHFLVQKPKKAQRFAQEALTISQKENDYEGVAKSRLTLANALRFQRKFDEMLATLNPTLPILDKLNNNLVAEILSSIGFAHYQLGHDTVSMDHFFQKIGNENYTNENKALSEGLKNIGNFYKKTGNYPKAIEFFYKSAQIDSLTNDSLGIGSALYSIGDVLTALGKAKTAIRFYRKAIGLVKGSGIEPALYISLANAIQTEHSDLAKDLINKIDSLPRNLSDFDTFWIHMLKSRMHAMQNQSEKSLLHIDSAMQYVNSKELWYNLVKVELEIAEIVSKKSSSHAQKFFELARNHASANLFHQYHGKALIGLANQLQLSGNKKMAGILLSEYSLLHDSIIKEVRRETVKQISMQQNYENLEKKVEAYRKDTKIQNLVIEKERVRRLFLMIILAIALPLLLIITLLYIERQRVNRWLEEKNHQINQQNEELNTINEQLASSRQQLIALNKTKDKFFSIIAHDLKSPLVSLKTFLSAIREPTEDHHESLTSKIDELEGLLGKVIDLINNLLFWALSQENSIRYNPEKFNLKETICDELSLAQSMAKRKGIDLQVKINESQMLLTDRNMLLFIVRNLVANAIKFTQQKGEITIEFESSADFHRVTVSDTGKGIGKEDLEKLFDLEKKISANANERREGTGLGLMLCREFAQKMGGRIEVESEPGKGSRFSLLVPIKTS
jgi:signal transduction histidine kinase